MIFYDIDGKPSEDEFITLIRELNNQIDEITFKSEYRLLLKSGFQ